MKDQEIYDKLCLLNQTTFNNEPLEVQEYIQSLVTVEAPQIVTGMIEELIKEFDHCWLDGTIGKLVVG